MYLLGKTIQILKGQLSGLRQFLTIESPLKIMKNTFYFRLRSLFVLEIFVLAVFLCSKTA